MNKRYSLFVNGILARKYLTRNGAIKDAMRYFPSYIVNDLTKQVVWKGDK